mmetsp:Transcript_13564/g.29177  ORF Transcript_13564/g.29177 Transcript_13564/m.29177 type:complete len:170 (+) Transcript_13564:181-690(+)
MLTHNQKDDQNIMALDHEYSHLEENIDQIRRTIRLAIIEDIPCILVNLYFVTVLNTENKSIMLPMCSILGFKCSYIDTHYSLLARVKAKQRSLSAQSKFEKEYSMQIKKGKSRAQPMHIEKISKHTKNLRSEEYDKCSGCSTSKTDHNPQYPGSEAQLGYTELIQTSIF